MMMMMMMMMLMMLMMMMMLMMWPWLSPREQQPLGHPLVLPSLSVGSQVCATGTSSVFTQAGASK
eukprot:696478-Amphidinium_carterae.1